MSRLRLSNVEDSSFYRAFSDPVRRKARNPSKQLTLDQVSVDLLRGHRLLERDLPPKDLLRALAHEHAWLGQSEGSPVARRRAQARRTLTRWTQASPEAWKPVLVPFDASMLDQGACALEGSELAVQVELRETTHGGETHARLLPMPGRHSLAMEWDRQAAFWLAALGPVVVRWELESDFAVAVCGPTPFDPRTVGLLGWTGGDWFRKSPVLRESFVFAVPVPSSNNMGHLFEFAAQLLSAGEQAARQSALIEDPHAEIVAFEQAHGARFG